MKILTESIDYENSYKPWDSLLIINILVLSSQQNTPNGIYKNQFADAWKQSSE